MSEKYFAQPSVMGAQAHFSSVPGAEIERSRFDRSHAYKTTFDAGLLIPVFCDEVLPGDTFDVGSTVLARLATPLKPFMDNVYLDMHFFFVPYRLCWDHWEEFCGENDKPSVVPKPVYTIPQVPIRLDQIQPDSIAGYFGLPLRVGVSTPVNVSALPFRAYGLIYNEWYRDENLVDAVNVPTNDGPDGTVFSATTKAFPRYKRHDYFTSCLPWPQKGDPVYVPLGTSAVVKTSATRLVNGVNEGVKFSLDTGGAIPGDRSLGVATTGSAFVESTPSGTNAGNVYPHNLYADLTQATAITINDLRTAFQIQRLLERDARGGTRYIELVLSHFGVRSDDARLQRPEYLGGGTTRINVNPIASTAVTDEVPQANLAAVGVGVGRGGFTKSFTEHGIVIGIVSARADLTYQQGIERFWNRLTRYDFYWPALAHLGEQAVLNREIFVQSNAFDTQVFGYQERYAEYRYKPSRITGLFSSEVSTSLDVWHLCQDFQSLPVLNGNFMREDPPIDRVIAVPTEPHFLADIWFDFKCSRPMPVYSVPGLIDHF